jgi:hypothetical protein
MQAQQIQQHTDVENGARMGQEGIIVWDQKGVVVVWPDGHCTRLAWTVLRKICQCLECREQREPPEMFVTYP